MKQFYRSSNYVSHNLWYLQWQIYAKKIYLLSKMLWKAYFTFSSCLKQTQWNKVHKSFHRLWKFWRWSNYKFKLECKGPNSSKDFFPSSRSKISYTNIIMQRHHGVLIHRSVLWRHRVFIWVASGKRRSIHTLVNTRPWWEPIILYCKSRL